MTPCSICNGDKEANRKGTRYCQACWDTRAVCKVCGNEVPKINRKICDSCFVSRLGMAGSKAPQISRSGHKWCNKCERELPHKKFATLKRGIAPWCKECTSLYHWVRRITKIFDLEPEEYFRLLEYQDGGCAICSARPKSRRLAIDHDHKTGVIRGLLCTWCNHKVLGGAKEDVDVLRNAVLYLENPPAPHLFTRRVPSG